MRRTNERYKKNKMNPIKNYAFSASDLFLNKYLLTI